MSTLTKCGRREFGACNRTIEFTRPLILVVDQELSLREIFAEVFNEEGYDTVFCTGGQGSVRRVASLAPDLILLDVLPRQQFSGGWMLLAELSSWPVTASIPVLATSASQLFDQMVESELRALTCGILFKPFDLEDLLSSVRSCLRRPLNAFPVESGFMQPPPR